MSEEVYIYHVVGPVAKAWVVNMVGQDFFDESVEMHRRWRSKTDREPKEWASGLIAAADRDNEISNKYSEHVQNTFVGINFVRRPHMSLSPCVRGQDPSADIYIGPFSSRDEGRAYLESFSAMAPLGVLEMLRVTEHRRDENDVEHFDECEHPSTGYTYEGERWELSSAEFELFDGSMDFDLEALEGEGEEEEEA